ncbi:LysR family transcriptional regulator [Pseudomonas sp. Z1-6]|uniref:LysR family transcriptional regulator n=1 Tax=unclassified Pseudomonas TaxID=196821 RepID=UPI003DA98404
MRSFKVFESVARLGSLAAAAVELHVTVGAVSQQVKALQASLGVELFEKRGRQLVLTSNGRQLQKRVANAMDEISDAVDALRSGSTDEPVQVEITLSIPPAEGVDWLTTPLLRFMEASRSVRVSVITAAGMPQVDWRRADVAVVYGTPPWSGLWWRLLHGIRMTPVCSPQYLRGLRGLLRGDPRTQGLVRPHQQVGKIFLVIVGFADGVEKVRQLVHHKCRAGRLGHFLRLSGERPTESSVKHARARFFTSVRMGCRPFYSSGRATRQCCRAYLIACGCAHQWTIFKAGHFKATKASGIDIGKKMPRGALSEPADA